MSGNLLDTNVALYAMSASHMLSESVRSAMQSGENALSVVTYWEVVLKSMKGKIDIGDPIQWWKATLRDLKAWPIDIGPEHVQGVLSLPPLHLDPFDRMLLAQASVTRRTLLTTDTTLARYVRDDLKVLF